MERHVVTDENVGRALLVGLEALKLIPPIPEGQAASIEQVENGAVVTYRTLRDTMINAATAMGPTRQGPAGAEEAPQVAEPGPDLADLIRRYLNYKASLIDLANAVGVPVSDPEDPPGAPPRQARAAERIEELERQLAQETKARELAEAQARLNWAAYVGSEAQERAAQERERVAHDHRSRAEQERIAAERRLEECTKKLTEFTRRFEQATKGRLLERAHVPSAPRGDGGAVFCRVCGLVQANWKELPECAGPPAHQAKARPHPSNHEDPPAS